MGTGPKNSETPTALLIPSLYLPIITIHIRFSLRTLNTCQSRNQGFSRSPLSHLVRAPLCSMEIWPPNGPRIVPENENAADADAVGIYKQRGRRTRTDTPTRTGHGHISSLICDPPVLLWCSAVPSAALPPPPRPIMTLLLLHPRNL